MGKTDVVTLTGTRAVVKIVSFRQVYLDRINHKENLQMIELTDPAKAQIDDYFQGKEPTPIRIFLNSGG